jgi:hypothetical protein
VWETRGVNSNSLNRPLAGDHITFARMVAIETIQVETLKLTITFPRIGKFSILYFEQRFSALDAPSLPQHSDIIEQ